ncbi:WXG100 family type VII secretion target [Mycolicibacterium sp.]|uniref:WXG100 family type VII secretion target n=1 Tax=Mycolicibacterium sp. TaxID=2320850 RepID=UPI0025E25EE9|nr:WXG100 family type VII secretion target [Mycolicibacterium sp.]MCB9409042.1 WXG100 family type VII secretion target [Mycolicibacterium sp.]
MTLVVTPEVLRSTRNAIESALEHATAIANGYLSTHEGLGSAVWGGQAQLASVHTAAQINQDLQQTITGGTRLAHGLSQAASLMEGHESEAAHSLTAFAANA